MVVVGGFKGTGALRGGKIAEYLVEIVEAPKAVGDERDPLGEGTRRHLRSPGASSLSPRWAQA